MKILHVVPSYKPAYIYGGPIESVAKLCEGLAALGHQVDVFTTTANGTVELDVEPGIPQSVDGINVTYFRRLTKDPTHISPSLWISLFSKVKSYDVVHIHSWWNILVLISALICIMRGVKVLVSPRGMLSIYIFNSGQSRIKKIIHKVIGKRLLAKTWFHATAKSEYNECRSIIPEWTGFVVPNILSLTNVPIERSLNEIFTLVFMSRIHPKKGLEFLFEAIASLPFPVKLKIAGSGDEEYIVSLRNLANELGIDHMIEWLGWVDRNEKFTLLMTSDLFTLVSFNENFANVVVESLHVGTPVLLSGGVALSEFVRDKDLGWVTTLDIEDIKDNLKESYSNLNKRERINATATGIVGDVFSQTKVLGKYESCYRTILNSKNRE